MMSLGDFEFAALIRADFTVGRRRKDYAIYSKWLLTAITCLHCLPFSIGYLLPWKSQVLP